MAQKFISPGIFTTEIDQSFVGQAPAGVGAVIVGGAEKGPAFEPVRLANFQEHLERFGNLNVLHQASYASRNYLANSGIMHRVRVLGHDDGTGVNNGYQVGGITGITDASGSDDVTGSIMAVIHHSGTSSELSVVGVSDDGDRFVFTIGTFSATASFLTSSADYIEKVLNTDPTRYTTDNHYLYQTFKYTPVAASASWHLVAVSGADDLTLNDFQKNYAGGSTPWVKSQLIGANEYDLFKFHTRAHGRVTNDELKISIRNVRPSINTEATPYGTFDLAVRSFYDTDLRQEVLETFANLTLDPNDKNYIARRIGDQIETFDTDERKMAKVGDYANKSNHIRVEINKNNGSPPEALPWGFRGYTKMLYSGSDTDEGEETTTLYQIDDMTYTPNMRDKNSVWNAGIHWGVLFVSGGVVDRMRAVPNLDTAAKLLLTGSDADFSLKHLSGTYESGKLRYHYNTTQEDYAPIYGSASLQQFTMPLEGGFDGFDFRTENSLDVSNTAADTNFVVTSMKRALDVIADPDFIDANLLVVPGVHNTVVTDHARNVVNDRRDMIYIMDITGSTVTQAIDNLKSRNIDDNYSAVYYPDVKIDDEVNNRVVRIAPSVVAAGAIAYNDKIAQPFFAPAGMNRGGLDQFSVVDVVDRLNYTNRSDLYDNRINPIASFPNEGITIWGQKTMQVAASSLDRINVRRLLIFAKRTIKVASKELVFEPNNSSTYTKFTNKVNPILEKVRQDRGIERFKVVMDVNTNTPDVVDRNTMVGKIFLQPTKSVEFVDLRFIITNAGVQFEE